MAFCKFNKKCVGTNLNLIESGIDLTDSGIDILKSVVVKNEFFRNNR